MAHSSDGRHPIPGERYAREFEACDALIDFASSVVSPWSGRPLEEGTIDGIVASEGARALQTFKAVVNLCGNGFGPQASMLNRALFEGTLVAHWAVDHPEEAVERFAKHDRHVKLRWAETVERLGWDIGDRELPTATAEETKELTALFGRHGERPWTGLSVYELLNDVEHHWGDEDGRASLWTFYRVAYLDSNLTLHSSAWSLTTGVTSAPDGTHFPAGPSNYAVAQALYGAYWSYAQTLRLTIEHFGMPSADDLENVFQKGHPAFVELTSEMTRAVGRNDPCPCGSGLKFKRCHGS